MIRIGINPNLIDTPFLISWHGFLTFVAVAVAVCVSAVSVLAAVPYFISKQAISLDVLVFAAPGALIGGFLARHLAVWLGAHKLKIAASGWIILSSLPYLTFHLID